MSIIEDYDKGGNPICFLDVDGFRYPIVDPEIVKQMSEVKVNEDDIILVAYPKSGTHWLWEVTSMLLQGKAETIPYWKSVMMIELQPESVLQAYPSSPRVFNTHVRYNQLPVQAREKKCHIIYVLRNPKDITVSFYNHHKSFPNAYHDYNGLFDDYLPFFLEGKTDYGSWFDSVLQWEKDLEEQRNRHPIHVIFFEDMKDNYVGEIRKLATFLKLPGNETLYSSIAEKCAFHNMKLDKHPYDPKINDRLAVYRKGEVGDWLNWFSREQNEMFEKLFHEKMKNSKFIFRFTL